MENWTINWKEKQERISKNNIFNIFNLSLINSWNTFYNYFHELGLKREDMTRFLKLN